MWICVGCTQREHFGRLSVDARGRWEVGRVLGRQDLCANRIRECRHHVLTSSVGAERFPNRVIQGRKLGDYRRLVPPAATLSTAELLPSTTKPQLARTLRIRTLNSRRNSYIVTYSTVVKISILNDGFIFFYRFEAGLRQQVASREYVLHAHRGLSLPAFS